jgi:hypothetical protein
MENGDVEVDVLFPTAASSFTFLLCPLFLHAADGNLFIIVFGESVINDAVAEVLFKTISNFLDYEGHTAVPVNAREVWRGKGLQ